MPSTGRGHNVVVLLISLTSLRICVTAVGAEYDGVHASVIRIAAAQQGITRIDARLSRLANEHIEKLAENLDRDNACVLRQFANGENLITPIFAIGNFGIGEDIRIERDPHLSSS